MKNWEFFNSSLVLIRLSCPGLRSWYNFPDLSHIVYFWINRRFHYETKSKTMDGLSIYHFSGIFAKILKNFNILWNAKATGVDTTKHSIKTCLDFLINIDKLQVISESWGSSSFYHFLGPKNDIFHTSSCWNHLMPL